MTGQSGLIKKLGCGWNRDLTGLPRIVVNVRGMQMLGSLDLGSLGLDSLDSSLGSGSSLRKMFAGLGNSSFDSFVVTSFLKVICLLCLDCFGNTD